MSVAEEPPRIVERGYMLQQLAIFDFGHPILTSHEDQDILAAPGSIAVCNVSRN